MNRLHRCWMLLLPSLFCTCIHVFAIEISTSDILKMSEREEDPRSLPTTTSTIDTTSNNNSGPDLPIPFDGSYAIQSNGPQRTETDLRWRYGNLPVEAFRVSIYYHDEPEMSDVTDYFIVGNQTDLTVDYLPQESEYNVTFATRPSKIYCIQVIALRENGTVCSDALMVRFSTNATEKGEEESEEDPVVVSILLVLVVTSSLLALLSIGGCFCWRKWMANVTGQGIRIHSLQRHRVEYQSSASSKSSCLTKATYLSTEREDINVLYVEQEIQEARDKGIADFFEISYGRLTIGHEIGKGAFGRVCIATAEAIAATPGKVTVAVKYLRENPKEQEKEDFLSEISTMKKAGQHPNVVTMLACCTLQQPYCMVMEYVECGDLLNYLRRLRSEYEKVTGTIVGISSCEEGNGRRMADDEGSAGDGKLNWPDPESSSSNEKLIEVEEKVKSRTPPPPDGSKHEGLDTELLPLPAAADVDRQDTVSTCSKATEETVLLMSGESGGHCNPSFRQWEHGNVCLDPLELQSFALQIANGMCHLSKCDIVHRDLAARNVLIDRNKRLKVADFGLSRSGIYVTQRGGRVPLRWLSVEAIRDNLYSTASDVWAFGIVLWEICTLGGFPYSSISDKDLFRHLIRNNRLERPVHCSEDLYSLMTSCWNSDPKERPSFGELLETLEQMGRRDHTYVNFDVSENVIELPPADQQRGEERQNQQSSDSTPKNL